MASLVDYLFYCFKNQTDQVYTKVWIRFNYREND